jgi:hypothetical protein
VFFVVEFEEIDWVYDGYGYVVVDFEFLYVGKFLVG